MTRLTRIFLVCALIGLTSCSVKRKILDVNIISMSHYYIPSEKTLKVLGPVYGKFCTNVWDDKGTIGIIDKAVLDAEKKANADFLTQVSVFREGNCYQIEANAARLVDKTDSEKKPIIKNKKRSLKIKK